MVVCSISKFTVNYVLTGLIAFMNIVIPEKFQENTQQNLLYVLDSFTTALAYSFHQSAIQIHYINVAPYS